MILILGCLLRSPQIPLRSRSLALALTAVMLAGAGCSDPADQTQEDGVTIVATTTVLGDVASAVLGDAGTVEVIIPVGVDPHDFQASSQQGSSMARADLVVANGLDLEEGLGAVLESAEADGTRVLELAPLLDPLPMMSGGQDPHVWMDPLRMADAGRLIAAELTAIDGSKDWGARAEEYADELMQADTEIRDTLSVVPSERRVLITNHDSFGYFADRYGFDIVGVVIPGGSTLAEPSAAELAQLVRTIESQGVTAIFAETTQPVALAEAVAAEAGNEVQVVELYTGSLGEPGSGADTLPTMLLTNARRIAEALQ